MACTLDKDHTYNQPVKIQSLVDPATYWLIPDQKEPPGNKIDQLLTERIRNTSFIHFTPIEEQMVAVMDPTTTIWHRGKVKTIFLGEQDNKYLVFLVDYGINLKVSHNLVRELPTDETFQKEHHATQFKLYGVVPCKKQVACQPDFKLVSVSGKEWDPIAYKFIANKSEVATAIYMSTMKGVDLCAGDVIQGDLHFLIGGRCISMIDDLCSNQYAIYNEVLFNQLSGISKEEESEPLAVYHQMESKPQTVYHQMKSENLPVACSGSLIGKQPPSTSHGPKTPVRSSWVSPTKEPVLIPGGMNINVLTQKTKRQESRTTKNENKFPYGTNNPNSTSRNTATSPNTSAFTTSNITKQQNSSFSPNSTVTEPVKDVTEDTSTQSVGRSPTKLSGCTSLGSNETESSPKTIQVVNVSPKTTNDVVPKQFHDVVSPISPDSPQQCVTARGRRLQALLKDLATTKEKGNANESLEETSFNSSLDSLSVSGNESSTSGLFGQIKTAFDNSKTESDDSNCGLTPVNSPRTVNNESPSTGPSVNVVQNKFLSLLDDLY